MTISLTYEATLARVRIAATSLPTGVDTVTVERSTTQTSWTTVRGGGAATVTAGAAALDDYEFVPGVANYYRVSAVDAGAVTYIGAGTAVTGNNSASLAPALPVGWEPGDLALILASIRNSGTGTVTTPTGWTAVATSGNVSLLGRRLETGDTGPTVAFAGGVANADVLAQAAVFRNADLLTAVTATQLNGSATTIAYPARTVSGDGQLIVVAGWKADDWTAVSALAGMTEIAETVSTAGDDAGQVWDYRVQTTAANIGASTFTVSGGASAISRGVVAVFPPAPYRIRETDSITPAIDRVWLKSIVRPFLNREVTVRDFGDITRPDRGGVFEVVGRSYPVAVTDVRGSRRFSLELRTLTEAEADDLRLILASGDVLYLQVPPTGQSSAVPTAYVSVGDATERRPTSITAVRLFSLPCTEVAPPGPDVVGATVTWQTVINAYATWADLMADQATWADLLELVGSPGDVIVP